MKAKVKATGEIVEVAESRSYDNESGFWGGNSFYYPDELDFNTDPPHPEATISGWVARAQKGTLGLLRIKPERRCGDWWIGVAPEDSAIYRLPSELFPSLTWQDEPIEVELTIKIKQQ